MRKHILVALVLMSATSCVRLDSFFYANDGSISEYHLRDYEGETEIQLPENYFVPDSTIHLFTLASDLDGDIASIYACYVGDITSIATDTVILYLHGNRDHLDFYWPRIELLANTGGKNRFGVLAIDFRGFGLSEGTPTEAGLYADSDAAMQWLKAQGLTDDRLIIYGFSMGTAPAVELTAAARSMQPSKLMIEAPFASDEVFVEDASGLSLPGSYFSDLEIDNAEEIKSVAEPLFWIHGMADDYIQIETHGEVVFKNYHGIYGEAHRIEGAGHSDIPSVMGYPEYLDAINDFLAR